jgi:hypothetical protein
MDVSALQLQNCDLHGLNRTLADIAANISANILSLRSELTGAEHTLQKMSGALYLTLYLAGFVLFFVLLTLLVLIATRPRKETEFTVAT